MDLPSDVDTETDRVFFIKAVAQFMVMSSFPSSPTRWPFLAILNIRMARIQPVYHYYWLTKGSE